MATTFAALPQESTGAQIRIWSEFVENTFLSGGWLLTSDLGQTPPSSLPAPTGTGNNIKLGFRIYYMADKLQGSNPVFVRVDYGTGRTQGFTPPPHTVGMWLTIGTGSDGNGNITGTMLATTETTGQLYASTGGSGLANSYGSADINRVAVSLFSGIGSEAGSQICIAFSIERSKDVNGLDTGDGLLVTFSNVYSGSSGPTNVLANSVFLQFNVPVLHQPPVCTGLHFIHSTNDPSPTLNGDRGLGVLFHYSDTMEQPGICWLVTNVSDLASESYINMYIYGFQHTYQHMGGGLIPGVGCIAPQPFGSTNTADTFRRMLMLYE